MTGEGFAFGEYQDMDSVDSCFRRNDRGRVRFREYQDMDSVDSCFRRNDRGTVDSGIINKGTRRDSNFHRNLKPVNQGIFVGINFNARRIAGFKSE
jgi:hypothetical protein